MVLYRFSIQEVYLATELELCHVLLDGALGISTMHSWFLGRNVIAVVSAMSWRSLKEKAFENYGT